jgi:hypothetical protein
MGLTAALFFLKIIIISIFGLRSYVIYIFLEIIIVINRKKPHKMLCSD